MYNVHVTYSHVTCFKTLDLYGREMAKVSLKLFKDVNVIIT